MGFTLAFLEAGSVFGAVYVLIAMRYEERDLLYRFGGGYGRWRGITG